MAANDGEWTVFNGVHVTYANTNRVSGQDIGPAVQVSFPDHEWDRVSIFRRFATIEEAKAAAQQLAVGLKALKPTDVIGFFGNPKLNTQNPNCVAARTAVDSFCREWAGADSVVIGLHEG